jgi:glutaredoxin 3
MADILVYSKLTCPYCVRAKKLLKDLGQTFQDVDIAAQPEKRDEMIEKAGGHKVPQIFIDHKHIGGCDDLFALHEQGQLTPLLK